MTSANAGSDPGAAAQAAPVSDTDLVTLLAGWLPQQRWYAAKQDPDAVVGITDRNLVAVAGEHDLHVTVEQVLIEVSGSHGRSQYQLWLAWQPEGTGAEEHAGAIGTAGGLSATDALLLPAVSRLLITTVADAAALGPVHAVREPDADIDITAHGMVIGAEQSNTSIVYGHSAILKMFRRLEPGPNPDAEVHRALAAAGCRHIAEPLGELIGPVGDEEAGRETTLGLLTRFYPNSAEGWAMALSSVRDLMAEGDLRADEVGGDFAAEAHRLGEAVAAVHADLAGAFGGRSADTDELRRILDDMAIEARSAAEQAPSLTQYLPGILAVFEQAAAHAASLQLQRVHGDLHLGQTLRTLTGWLVIDFEGEPAKPLAFRRSMQSPLKDIAGMLRSFDYAAHQPLVGGRPDAQHVFRAAEWAARNSTAFCDGYAAAAGTDPRQAGGLLRAFELDKAVYEVVYEHGHRPSWESIPLQAVSRLINAGGSL
ncbi:maltokinase N-terminal cap-like domain-containing protein [Nakamurella leprariae]|uniref:Maltokinase n=1 Tax=Nakamurella leprariae TaxID=2803911 RepID=A0A938YES7_9ACTN|nr:maltokinase [Nakamurella leprariae]MBM9466844.1 maltokinase [Nakamurella leprariae]